jgi:hypothetical protein
MKKLIPAFAIILGWAATGWAAPPAPLTSLRAIHALSNAEVAQAPPVAFEATVTYFRWYEKTLFVQDDGNAIYVAATTSIRLLPGDRILIKGAVQPSFNPFVCSNDIALLHHGALPQPIPATYDDLLHAPLDCKLVLVHAVVRSADLVLSSDRYSTSLQLLTGGGSLEAVVDNLLCPMLTSAARSEWIAPPSVPMPEHATDLPR